MKEMSAAMPAHLMHQATDSKRKNTLQKDDFLRLLMTQLKHQDPLNPKDHEQFATQLAQFSSLEQLSNIGKGIDKLQGGMSSEEKLQALGMIGKEVKASGNKVELLHEKEVSLEYLPDSEVQPFKASIYNKGGQLVRELSLANQKPTSSSVNWDGKNHLGEQLPPGDYTFRVFGIGGDGQTKELSAELSGRVIGVEVQGKSPMLLVKTNAGNARVELAKITKVSLGGDEKVSPNKTVGGEGKPNPLTSTGVPTTTVSGKSDANPAPDRQTLFGDRQDWLGSVDTNALGRYQR